MCLVKTLCGTRTGPYFSFLLLSSSIHPTRAPTRPFSCNITLQYHIQVGLLVRSDLSTLSQLPALFSRIVVLPLHQSAASPAPQCRALPPWARWPGSLHTTAPTSSSAASLPAWCPLQVLAAVVVHHFPDGWEKHWKLLYVLSVTRFSSGDMPRVTARDCLFGWVLNSLLPKPRTMHAIDIIYSYLLRECAKSTTLPKSIPTKLSTSPENIISFVWKAWFSFKKAELTATNNSCSF